MALRLRMKKGADFSKGAAKAGGVAPLPEPTLGGIPWLATAMILLQHEDYVTIGPVHNVVPEDVPNSASPYPTYVADSGVGLPPWESFMA
jgi:hypothetical protein